MHDFANNVVKVVDKFHFKNHVGDWYVALFRPCSTRFLGAATLEVTLRFISTQVPRQR